MTYGSPYRAWISRARGRSKHAGRPVAGRPQVLRGRAARRRAAASRIGRITADVREGQPSDRSTEPYDRPGVGEGC